MKKSSYWALLSLSFLIPVILFVYFDFVAPRPYGLAEIDAENELSYGARLVYSGQPQFFVSHPATPIVYLAAGVLAVSGPELASQRRFFVSSHLVVAFLSGLALSVFASICLRTTPVGVSALAVASVIAWPTFLTFLDYIDSNSYNVPFGLLVLCLFWNTLEQRPHPSWIKLLSIGLLLGLCLATKLSF